jgi:hypothetical protein
MLVWMCEPWCYQVGRGSVVRRWVGGKQLSQILLSLYLFLDRSWGYLSVLLELLMMQLF